MSPINKARKPDHSQKVPLIRPRKNSQKQDHQKRTADRCIKGVQRQRRYHSLNIEP